ncbi:MAG: hypothetical protein VXZ82_18685 [Planctomycetota bacterium]|nr:hypothetical protein [Planctomycetota bacterium]
MNKLLIAGLLAAVGTFVFADSNRAHAQFGYSYGVPIIHSTPYCSTNARYGYSSYRPSHYVPQQQVVVSRSRYNSPVYGFSRHYYPTSRYITPGYGLGYGGIQYVPGLVRALPRVQLRLGF